MFVVGTLAAWGDGLSRRPSLSRTRRRIIGTALSAAAVTALCIGFTAVAHGHPFRFISRQWNGFSQPQVAYSASSHFVDVGSTRYDFWRVSLDALLAHPIGGLGQDNFADYYLVHRRTLNETSATHSLEMRLLAHTGVVGFLLFAAFLVAALRPALRARRRGDALTRGVAAAALMPLVVWVIHGSVDWFWEFPALSAPALGFLAVAGSLGTGRGATERDDPLSNPAPRVRRLLRPAGAGVAVLAWVAAAVALSFPYLSAREVSLGSDARAGDPAAALSRSRHRRRAQPAERAARAAGRHDRPSGRAVRRGGAAVHPVHCT